LFVTLLVKEDVSIFETLFKLALVLGFAYLFYKICVFLYHAGQTFFEGIGWVFQGNKLDTLRRLLYLIIIIGFIASIYYFGFMWWMIPVALISLIGCWLTKKDPSRRLFAIDIGIALRKWIVRLCVFILVSVVLYYFFSDVSILEVGISGVLLGFWELILDIGKFILAVIGFIVFLKIFGGGLTGSTVSERPGITAAELMEENLRESGSKRW